MASPEEENNLDLSGLETEERRDTLVNDPPPPLPPRTSQSSTPRIPANGLTSSVLDLSSSSSLSCLSISNEKTFSSYTTAGSMNLVELVNKLLRPTETCHIISFCFPLPKHAAFVFNFAPKLLRSAVHALVRLHRREAAGSHLVLRGRIRRVLVRPRSVPNCQRLPAQAQRPAIHHHSPDSADIFRLSNLLE